MPWGMVEPSARPGLRWEVERNDGGAQEVETGGRDLTVGLKACLLRGAREDLDVAAAAVDVGSGTARVVVALLAAAGRPRQAVQGTGVQNRRGIRGKRKKHQQEEVEKGTAHDRTLPRVSDLRPRSTGHRSSVVQQWGCGLHEEDHLLLGLTRPAWPAPRSDPDADPPHGGPRSVRHDRPGAGVGPCPALVLKGPYSAEFDNGRGKARIQDGGRVRAVRGGVQLLF